MHYFIHGPAIAAVEDDDQAAKYIEAGWEEITCAAFVQAWRRRDLAQLDAMRPDAPPIRDWMPTGLYRYKH